MAASSILDSSSEHARLEALQRYAILDTAPERDFDELVQRAARDCGYPTALITLMDAERCWFKSTTGVPTPYRHLHELPRDQTFCHYAFRSSGIFVVLDAQADERVRHLAIVNRPDGFRAYLGAQLITPDGHSIGTVSALDTIPRAPTAAQMDALRATATRVMALLETRVRDRAPAPEVALAPETKTPAPVRFAPAKAAVAGPRDIVLIVDDEDLIRRVTAAMIARFGYETLPAANGREGLERLAALPGRVRLILTDIHMPVMDGLEMIRAIRALPAPPPIVAMSGRFTPEIRAELRARGVTHLIAKPFALAEIELALKAGLAVAP